MMILIMKMMVRSDDYDDCEDGDVFGEMLVITGG